MIDTKIIKSWYTFHFENISESGVPENVCSKNLIKIRLQQQ